MGFPNAGKSTLVARLSAARPKIADYPFTTLVPTLGLVRLDEERSFVIADVPGLIPGAAEGKGLGLRFLRHLERTRVLVHLLDLDPATGRDPVEDWRTIQAELKAYSPELAARPQLVAANKIDLEGAAPRLKRVVAMGRRRRLPVFPLAARTGQGLAELRAAIGAALAGGARRPRGGSPRVTRRRLRRVVVKVGSGLIADPVEGPDPARIEPLAAEVAALMASGVEVALVTSGAIAAGHRAARARREAAVDSREAGGGRGRPGGAHVALRAGLRRRTASGSPRCC